MASGTQIQDSGSNYQFYDKQIDPNVKRSGFNLNRIRMTTANFGVLQPVLKQYAMPNSDITFNYEMNCTAIVPPSVPLGSRQRIFYHLYKVNFQQMWPKWGTFMSKGRNGNTVVPLPTIRFCIIKERIDFALQQLQQRGITRPQAGSPTYAQKAAFTNKVFDEMGCLGPNTLTNFLGFPCPANVFKAVHDYVNQDTSSIAKQVVDFSAFPFFAYLSIWRNFYVNGNLEANNTILFPDDENDFALVDPDIPGTSIFFASRNDYLYDQLENPDNPSRASFLEFGYFKYRNFVDDYFTSALPWPMRGNIPELDLSGTIDLDEAEVKFKDPVGNHHSIQMNVYGTLDGRYSTTILNNNMLATSALSSVLAGVGGLSSVGLTDGDIGTTGLIGGRLVTDGTASVSYTSGFTWEMIRNLSISTIIQEKMARTDGSYVDFVKTFFDVKPTNYANNIPVYLGGDLQPILYRRVVQVSESANTPLGTLAGEGLASSEGFLGKAHFDDFGLVLGLISIMPDIYYSQGIHRIETYQVQEDFPLPERTELGMQGVLNKEIYFTGDDSATADNGLFGYQNLYDEWRYAPNELSGELTNPGSANFFPLTQSRVFTSIPKLSAAFVSSNHNIRTDYLSAQGIQPFFLQIANRIRVVQPLPYKAVPVGLK